MPHWLGMAATEQNEREAKQKQGVPHELLSKNTSHKKRLCSYIANTTFFQG
jgi:hypothetical protein